MTVPTWAVVPSNGRSYLKGCLDALAPQVDGIVVVQNGDDDIFVPVDVHVVRDTETDMNISRWWNLGIDAIAAKGLRKWNTLIVNDDVVIPVGLVETLSARMRACTAVVAYPNQHDHHHALWREPGPVNLFHRLTGYCYMLRGEVGLRLDESMKWWASDDDLDWRARELGGSLLIPGHPVVHHAPNGSFLHHPELHEQAAQDMETFAKKWGMRPW